MTQGHPECVRKSVDPVAQQDTMRGCGRQHQQSHKTIRPDTATIHDDRM